MAVVVALALPGAARAATITVNTTADETTSTDGLCSLREAIGAVDSPGTPGDCGTAGFGANTIALGPQRYVLSIPGPGAGNATGDLNVQAAGLTIAGAGPNETVIDATGLGDRLLAVDSGSGVTISGLTLTGGHAPDGSMGSAGADFSGGSTDGGTGGLGGQGANGGGIYNAGSLTLNAVAVINSTAGSGGSGGTGGMGRNGGAGGAGGSAGAGGGIYNAGTGTLTLTDATISGNRGGTGGAGGAGGNANYSWYDGGNGGAGSGFGDGGGVYNSGGTLIIANSRFSFNTAGNGGKGGNGGESGALDSNGGNGGNGGIAAWGGGVASIGGSLSVTDSTFAGNHGGDGGGGGAGGAVGSYNPGGTGGHGGTGGNGGGGGDGGGLVPWGSDSLLNATVASNAVGLRGAAGAGGSPDGSPGGIYPALPAGGGVYVPSGPLALRNTLFAQNGGANCAGPGTITDGGHNLSFGDTSCPAATNGDPRLGPLQDNGGSTQTMALQPGSAAIDQVPAAGSGCPATDQRGVSRPQGSACDIGAFEYSTPTVTIAAPADGGRYRQGASVAAAYSCDEGAIANAIASCTGPAANGQAIDTASPGTKTFTATATDKAGVQASKTVSYTVVRVVIGKLRQTHRRWSERKRHGKHAPPVGTTFRFTLNIPVTVTLAFTQVGNGRTVKGRCVRQSKHNRRKPKCRMTLTRGKLTVAAKAGDNALRFNGTLPSGRKLKPGSYTMTISVADHAGNESAHQAIGFTILR